MNIEQPSFGEIATSIKDAPATWLPALLVCVVQACINRKVFKEGGLVRTVQNAILAAYGQKPSDTQTCDQIAREGLT